MGDWVPAIMATRLLKALIIIFGLLAGACITLAQVAEVTQAPPRIDFADWREVDRGERTIEYTVSFPSAYTTPHPANNAVPVRILMPAGARQPVPSVIVLHYWGARDLKVERALGAELNRRGVAAVLMALPYHLSRTPPGHESGELAVEPEPTALIANMTQSVWDVRRCVDWIESRPEFAGRPVGIEGTSLGAVVASLAYALEPRITHATFVLGGADIAHIIWNSSRTVRERDALRRQGYTEDRLRQAIAAVEPLNYLGRRSQGSAFVVAARFDTVVPTGSTSQLVRALRGPKALYVETGHYGGIFVQRRLLREVASYFAAEFGGSEFVPPGRIYAPTVRIGALAATSSGFDLCAGLDLFRFDRRGDGYCTLLITPRGPQVFAGRKIDDRLAIGGFATLRGRLGLGLIWSTVL